MKIFSLILLLATLQNASWAQLSFRVDKIVGGTPVPTEDHPGHWNTVALVKEEGKIFCTGAVVAPNLVVTAKHCLMDKKDQKIQLYFGDDTTKPDAGLYRPIIDYDVRHPVDWTMTFPSFDIAWVKFSGGLPHPFKPLPVLSNPKFLEKNMEVTQVGFGDHNPDVGSVDAGQKLHGKTRLHNYINNPRFFHILVFNGDEGQGSCHGDSGGPAYVKVRGEWFIAGVTNGFDIVLTPRAMVRTGDPDFPYNVDCAQNQSLYSFVGAHGAWIEESSQTIIEKSSEFENYDRQKEIEPTSISQWCQLRDIGSPQWNLLKILLDKNVDSMPQEDAADFYSDCEKIEKYLTELSDISLDHNEVMEGILGFAPLSLLPNLKELSVYNFPREMLKLETLKNLNLKELTLKNNGITNLLFLKENTVESLSLEQNPLYSLRGIQKIKGLTDLTLSGTPLKDLSPLQGLNIKSLSAVGLNSSIVLGLDKISNNLEKLDLRNTIIPDSGLISTMLNLKELWLSGDIGPVDLTNLRDLEYLSVKDFKEGDLIFPSSLQNLKELSASQNDLQDISFIKTAPQVEKLNLTFNRIRNLEPFYGSGLTRLRELNLSANPILNAAPIVDLPGLKVLRLFRTPLQTGLIPKTEENCPTLSGPAPLTEFCQK